MTSWAPPRGVGEVPGFLEALQACFLPATYDGVTMATPLDVLRQNESLLMEDLWAQSPVFGRWAGIGWEWVNIAFLAGGLWLLQRRIFSWHAPLAMLASLALLAAIFYDGLCRADHEFCRTLYRLLHTAAYVWAQARRRG
mgnify:CR=1 FL=1